MKEKRKFDLFLFGAAILAAALVLGADSSFAEILDSILE